MLSPEALAKAAHIEKLLLANLSEVVEVHLVAMPTPHDFSAVLLGGLMLNKDRSATPIVVHTEGEGAVFRTPAQTGQITFTDVVEDKDVTRG